MIWQQGEVVCAFFDEKDVLVGTPKILQIWVDSQSQPFMLGYLNDSHQATRKMSKLLMPFLQANSEISSSFAARPGRYADCLTILRLRPAAVKSAFRFCHLQPFNGSRQTRRADPLQDSIILAMYCQCLSHVHDSAI